MLLNPNHELFKIYICDLKTELQQVENGTGDQTKYSQTQPSPKVEEYRELIE